MNLPLLVNGLRHARPAPCPAPKIERGSCEDSPAGALGCGQVCPLPFLFDGQPGDTRPAAGTGTRFLYCRTAQPGMTSDSHAADTRTADTMVTARKRKKHAVVQDCACCLESAWENHLRAASTCRQGPPVFFESNAFEMAIHSNTRGTSQAGRALPRRLTMRAQPSFHSLTASVGRLVPPRLRSPFCTFCATAAAREGSPGNLRPCCHRPRPGVRPHPGGKPLSCKQPWKAPVCRAGQSTSGEEEEDTSEDKAFPPLLTESGIHEREYRLPADTLVGFGTKYPYMPRRPGLSL